MIGFALAGFRSKNARNRRFSALIAHPRLELRLRRSATSLSSSKDFQFSRHSFHRCHVAAPPTWPHFDQGLGELVDPIRALLETVEGWHTLSVHVVNPLCDELRVPFFGILDDFRPLPGASRT